MAERYDVTTSANSSISAEIHFGSFGIARFAHGEGYRATLGAPGSHLFGSLSGSWIRFGIGAIAVEYRLAVSQLGLIACYCYYFQLIVA